MYKMILEWIEKGRQRSETFSSEGNSKEEGKVFIGRDKTKCDVVLPVNENTISRFHAVILYDSQNNCFFVRNLTSGRPQPNPITVDGKTIISEKVGISSGSVIQLGKIPLNVKLIEIIQSQKQYGLKCLNGHQIPYDYIGDFCPHCGFSLQAVETIFLPNEN
ncbi:MAG: FHA domain-containing protein [Cyanobacteria bacterium P01_A01_bin.80]